MPFLRAKVFKENVTSQVARMSHCVTVLPSGKTFTARADESVLEAALRQGIILPYGCRKGVCGSCKGRIRDGAIAYPAGLPDGIEATEAEAGQALFCQARATTDLVVEAEVAEGVADLEVRMRPCRVDAMERLNHDVMRLFLRLPRNDRLPFLAGQYLEFQLQDGRKRSFSMANAPHDDARIELHLRHVPGGFFTDYVFNEMQEKAVLRLRAPLGTFYLREDSPHPIILIAGGTGFAPIKAIVEHALHIGLTRPMHLYWGARSGADLYLPDLPREWARRHAQLDYTPVLSEPGPDEAAATATGFVHEQVARDYPDLSGHDVYLCGPPVMIQAARRTFVTECGLPEERLYFDSFEYAAASEAPDEA